MERLRNILCEDTQVFGDGDLQTKLDVAYQSFLQFCRGHRINHSQPPFLQRHVPKLQIWHPFIFALPSFCSTSPLSKIDIKLSKKQLLLHWLRCSKETGNGSLLPKPTMEGVSFPGSCTPFWKIRATTNTSNNMYLLVQL